VTFDRFWAQARLASVLPSRRGLYARPPAVGYLERASVSSRAVEVSGWVFGAGSELYGLSAAVDGEEVALRYGEPRADVGERFFGAAARCGFSGVVPASGGGTLRIWGHTAGGRRMLCFERALAASQPAPGLRRRVLSSVVVRQALMRAGVRDIDGALEALAVECAARRADPAAIERGFAPIERPPDGPSPEARARRRLLVVSAMFPSLAHGGGLRLYDILDAFSARYDVDLYAAFRRELDGDSLAELGPRLRSVRLWPSDTFESADIDDWLARHGRGPGEYDAIHFEWPQTAPLIPRLARLGGRRIFTLMECTTRAAAQALDADGPRGGAAWAFAEAYARESQALGASHHTVAVSDEDADFAVRVFGGARPLVVPTCLSPRGFLRQLPAIVDDAPPAPEAVFVGYFDHYPNRDAVAWYLREVHDAVRARVPGYRLRIVGRGDLGGLRGDDPSLVWVGPVDDLAVALRAGRVGVAPIISGAGMRGKLNQYAAAFRPIVSTRLGAEGLPYQHDKDILVADDGRAFADALVRLLTDDTLWRRLATAARATALAAFDWAPHLARLEALHV
jgi:glycosyltransferase involved in cell wall biosynthesis